MPADFVVKNGSVYCYGAECVERVHPWGTEAGAWRRFPGGAWQAYAPELRIDRLEALVGELGKVACLYLWRKRQLEAYRYLLEALQNEAKSAVRPFKSANWELLQLINRGGQAAYEILASNPAIGFVLSLSGEEGTALLGKRRREIAALFGFPERESSVRLLGKVAAGDVSVALVEALRAVALEGGPALEALSYLPRINLTLVSLVVDPATREALSFDGLRQLTRVRENLAHCDIVARVRSFVGEARRLGRPVPRLGNVGDVETALRPPPPAAAHRPEACPAGRSRQFPLPPIAETNAIRAIRTPDDLRAEGFEMRHCAGDYAGKVARGSCYFYRMLAPERATICLRKIRGTWRIGEVRGPGNRNVGASTMALISRWLEDVETARPQPARRRRVVAENQLAFDFG